jgi:hypothetical protein
LEIEVQKDALNSVLRKFFLSFKYLGFPLHPYPTLLTNPNDRTT